MTSAPDGARPNELTDRSFGISERTVKAQLTRVFQRLGVSNRVQPRLRACRMRRRPMMPVALVLLAVAGAGCASEPAPAAPVVSISPTTPASTVEAPVAATTAVAAEPAVLPEGFERVAASVTAADGTICELCLWLADDNDRRARGLMFVTDLGDADGMAFRYDSPRTGNFWMKNTLLPLSIGFFDADGAYMDAFDMEPCTADPCPTYRTPSEFLIAIETVEGGLPELGIGPGSTLTLTDLPCASP